MTSLNVLSHLLTQARHKKSITPPLDLIDSNASSCSVVQTEMGNEGARFFGLEEAPHTIEESNVGLLDKVRPSSPSFPPLAFLNHHIIPFPSLRSKGGISALLTFLPLLSV
jgi:hypothetical protein